MFFAHKILSAKPYNGQEVRYVQSKLDGHRITFFRQEIGSPIPIRAFTREGTDLWPLLSKKAKEEDIWPWLSELLTLPNRSSVDAELYIPGFTSSAVKTAIKDGDPNLTISAFAVPWWQGEKIYHASLQYAMDRCTLCKIPFADFITLSDPASINPEVWLAKCPAELEGYVVKQANYEGWWKLKKEKTIDGFITGFQEGKGKYKGTLGALEISVYGPNGVSVEICACSGMTDGERAMLWSSWDTFMFKVCEIKYQNVAANGRLRHPIFKRMRTDKTRKECTTAQDLDLLRYWNK